MPLSFQVTKLLKINVTCLCENWELLLFLNITRQFWLLRSYWLFDRVFSMTSASFSYGKQENMFPFKNSIHVAPPCRNPWPSFSKSNWRVNVWIVIVARLSFDLNRKKTEIIKKSTKFCLNSENIFSFEWSINKLKISSNGQRNLDFPLLRIRNLDRLLLYGLSMNGVERKCGKKNPRDDKRVSLRAACSEFTI